MATAIIMPKSGQSVESCIITSWHKHEGDSVSVGDLLFSYETDKAAFEEEAKVAGTLLKILAQEGDDVPCLENVCIIGEAGEDISSFVTSAPKEEAAAPAAAAAVVAPAAQSTAPATKRFDESRLFISPRAKNTAAERGVDPTLATPTGPDGRIIERDVMAISDITAQVKSNMAKAVSVPSAEYTDKPLTNIRKVIAKAMHHSISSMAQLTHHMSFDATNILNYRKQLKDNAEKLSLNNITLNDIVLFAVSRVLKNHPDLNAHFLEDKMRYFESVNLGMAVDTERGLLVPTIFGADKLSLNEISAKAKEVALSAQSGTIDPDLLQNGTFTISNLGALGVEMFTPVINPPQTGILGVCTTVWRTREVNGELKQYPAMGLSLTYDHRAIDGAPAQKFLSELCRSLENFSVLLAK